MPQLTSITAGKIDLEKKIISVKLKNGSSQPFHVSWLRDSCRCPKCVNPITFQKLCNPATFDHESLKPEKIEYDEENLLITWKESINGYHISKYSLDWLSKFTSKFLNPPSSQYEFPDDGIYRFDYKIAPIYWNSEFISESGLINSYNKVMESNEALEDLLKTLLTLGIAIIKGSPIEEKIVIKVARRIAYERITNYGVTFDVRDVKDSGSHFAYSAQPIEPHADLCYRERIPGVQLLHCIRNAVNEGFSLFSDGFHCASLLRSHDPALFEVLTRPVMFSFYDPQAGQWYRERWPIIATEKNGDIKETNFSIFAMRPPILPFDQLNLFYRAFKWYHDQIIDSKNQWKILLKPGDIAIFNNRRIFHGRTGYDSRSCDRFLQGCYMDWDEIMAKYEKLYKK